MHYKPNYKLHVMAGRRLEACLDALASCPGMGNGV
eukprot:CAMPEP_0195135006 /NCGR_PEP_ID=MMETSP0448-20130528/151708_1 /TAXON_ID=66468 /ORGANISM="Heterocapsa triquestra, Strain CCMP 448" /LENGTH=34 /DNA_ID= /DNA_START= /DNA_END= /DNA_ORIENTATION=